VDRRSRARRREHGLIPVIAPVAAGRAGETYNVNTDHVAAAVAASLDAALRALEGGVGSVRIVDGRRPHAVVLPLLARDGTGTEIAL
jgi:acetylglutamate kinase